MLSSLLPTQDSTSPRRRATSMKQLYRTSSGHSFKKNSTLSLKRQSHVFNEEPQSSFLAMFQFEKKRSKVPDDADQAMALLDEQIAKIRGDLETMRVEGKAMVRRVADVNARLDSVASSTSSRHNSLNSFEVVTEGDVNTTTTLGEKKLGSTSSLPVCDSKRDSGFVFDAAFEVDTRSISIPNNLAFKIQPKKAHSTTALDFIKNNLYENNGEKLKAESIDRLSCYSDSAILSIRGFSHPH